MADWARTGYRGQGKRFHQDKYCFSEEKEIGFRDSNKKGWYRNLKQCWFKPDRFEPC